jgi:alkylation response protein AidB-like acyl-CoA dehydrogenase
VDFELPGDDDGRRAAVREWLARHPEPSGRQLAEAGYVAPHWPRPWGLDADVGHQLIIDEELARAGVPRPDNPIGIGWAGPTILLAGTRAQCERYLIKALSGEERWCQLFSEPGAGSDLAGLTTRAERDGDAYVVNGAKTWTSMAHQAHLGILIARTDPGAPRHRGISYFVCPMDRPGISLRQVRDMTGARSFNQVFLDDVRLPADCLIGEENDGWRLARVTLGNERVSLSSGGALWGRGPTVPDLLALVAPPPHQGERRSGSGGRRAAEPVARQRLAQLVVDDELLRLMRLRTVSARAAGREPGPEASVQKLAADQHGQRTMAIAKDIAGAHGMLTGSGPAGTLPPSSREGPTEIPLGPDPLPGVDPVWHYGFCFAPALTIGGGTWAVQRNIVGERVLGLPRDVDTRGG